MQNIASALQCFLSWKWDDRFGVVLAEFGTEDKDKIPICFRAAF